MISCRGKIYHTRIINFMFAISVIWLGRIRYQTIGVYGVKIDITQPETAFVASGPG